jgi:hypothetical protein
LIGFPIGVYNFVKMGRPGMPAFLNKRLMARKTNKSAKLCL